jgi:hypothetical protein
MSAYMLLKEVCVHFLLSNLGGILFVKDKNDTLDNVYIKIFDK